MTTARIATAGATSPRAVSKASGVPNAVNDLVTEVLTQATATTMPLRPTVVDALRHQLTAAIGPLLAQLAAENARLVTELNVRSFTTVYVRERSRETATAEEEARRWERRWAGTAAQARKEHRRAAAAERQAAAHAELLREWLRLPRAAQHTEPHTEPITDCAACAFIGAPPSGFACTDCGATTPKESPDDAR